MAAACTSRPRPEPQEQKLEHWRRTAAELRELPFAESGGFLGLRPALHMRWIREDEIAEILREELLRALPGGDIERYRDAYASLGVLPRDLDLLQSLLRLQEEQLVGLYSVHRRTMYVVQDARPDGGYDPAMIVVHELVHALQHQHFPDTVRILQGLQHHDDVVTAMAAALEGDATLTMLGLSQESGLGRTAEGGRVVRDAMLADVEFPTGEMAAVPRLLRESLIFPYAYGTLIAARIFERGGNTGLDRMMRDPPLSTLRVRYPEDEDPVEFVKLPQAELAERVAPRGCRLGHHNVAGMLTLRVLLEDHGERSALEPLLRRWAGDRFLRVDCPEGPELAWLTRWDSEPGARHFAKTYRRIAASVAQQAGLRAPPEVYVAGRSALVLTSGLEPERELLLQGSATRAYAHWAAWQADGCFPNDGCP